jgi:colicin import membrane protein
MRTETSRLSRAIVLAITVHAVLLALLIVSFEWTPKTAGMAPQIQVVQAVAVDEKKVQAEMQKLKQTRQREQDRKEQQLRQLQQRLAQEKQQLQDLEKKRRETAAKRQAEAQQAKEAQRQAELKRKQEEAERQKQLQAQQEAAEKQRQEEAKREAELKAQQEKEAQRKAEEERRRKEAEQALQQQLAEEKAQRDQGVVAQYIGLIKQKVTQNWVRPAGWQSGQSCEVRIQLIPDGEVVNVQVLNSCGSPLSDQSVETAVSRASPLPLPPDPTLFDRFRDIKFIFKPKD